MSGLHYDRAVLEDEFVDAVAEFCGQAEERRLKLVVARSKLSVRGRSISVSLERLLLLTSIKLLPLCLSGIHLAPSCWLWDLCCVVRWKEGRRKLRVVGANAECGTRAEGASHLHFIT
jgi:hypothetical protein